MWRSTGDCASLLPGGDMSSRGFLYKDKSLLQVPELNRIQISRIYNLKNESDKHEFLEILFKQSSITEDFVDIEEIIDYLVDVLDEEWLTIYSGGSVAVKIGEKQSHSLSFLSDVIPLGRALLSLRDLDNHDRLIMKLHVKTFERLSTILEVKVASRYKVLGYLIELEPMANKKKYSDLKVKYNDEWIYFECKKENLSESKYFLQYNSYVEEINNTLKLMFETKLINEYRIDIFFYRRIPRKNLQFLYNKIRQCFENGTYNKWFEIEHGKFAINTRQTLVEIPPMHIAQSIMIVGTTPTMVHMKNSIIQVIYNPFGNKELQKIRRIIREANKQIPRNKRGVIILEVNHTEVIVKVAEEKLRVRGYEHIIAILLLGNGAWSIRNNMHADIPLDFLKIAAGSEKNQYAHTS